MDKFIKKYTNPAPHQRRWLALTLMSSALLAGCANKINADVTCRDLLSTGESALSRGETKVADECFQRALKMAEQNSDSNQRLIALALNDLALSAYSNREENVVSPENLQRAIDYQKRALSIEQKLYGPADSNVAYDLNNLGVWYSAANQLGDSASALEAAVKIRDRTAQAEPDQKTVRLLGITLGSLGNTYKLQKRYPMAEATFVRAARIDQSSKATLDQSHALNALADVYIAQGKDQEALATLATVLDLRQKIYGKTSAVAAETEKEISSCKSRLNSKNGTKI